MEQRRQERKAIDLEVVVSCPRFGLFRGRIENLSLKGVYVKTEAVSMCLRSPVSMTFQPAEVDPLWMFDAAGIVVHQDLGGFGVRFNRLSEHDKIAIEGFLIQGHDQVVSAESQHIMS